MSSELENKKAVSWFKCFVSGNNFPGELIGTNQPAGFYTTCFVLASSELEAKERAIQAIRSDERLRSLDKAIYSDTAKIDVEEVVIVSEKEVPSSPEGFVWYEE